MLSAAALKYREFRVKKCIFKLSGGASTTVSGQFLFGASKDPTVPPPTSTTFTFMEKNAKINIATPGSFQTLFDSEWHAIRPLGEINSEADYKLFTAGVMFMHFLTPSGGCDALKLDVDWTFEFRGRNPDYSAVVEDSTIMLQENIGVVAPPQALPQILQLPRVLTAAKRQYQLPTGAVRIRTIRINRNTVANECEFYDEAGANVTATRVLARQKIYSNAISYYNEYQVSVGSGFTTARGPNAADRLTVEELYCWVKDSDYLILYNDTNVGATFADSKLCMVEMEQLSAKKLAIAATDLANGVVPSWVGNLPAY